MPAAAYRSHAAHTKRRTIATLDVATGRVLHLSAGKVEVKLVRRFLHQVCHTYNELYGSQVRLLLV